MILTHGHRFVRLTGLTDARIGCPMAITAENLAEKYNISKEDCDAFAARSQELWAAADAAGRFSTEITPIELKGRKGPVIFERDEHPRPETTTESLSKVGPPYAIFISLT